MRISGFICSFFAAAALLGLSCAHEPHNGLVLTRFHVNISSGGNGSVIVEPPDTVAETGTRLVLTATPAASFVFTGWTGTMSLSQNPCTVVVNRDLVITARFAGRPAGMVLIPSAGRSFTMGATGQLAADNYELPSHRVGFSHDYFLSPCEITQGQFKTALGANPDQGTGALDIGDSFPVYGITWYQAALYCNARSKTEGYDTVYSYDAVCQTGQECPYVLENLAIHYDRFGYRLPTEAEWEYGCRAGSTGDYYWGNGTTAADSSAGRAWFTGNAGGHSQHVGTKPPNAFGLYDMAGNVAEWVADWLGFYPADSLTDPVGPSIASLGAPELDLQRPVRGGSWNLGTSFLRSSSRRGPYPTNAQLRQNDIGFRVALGAFFTKDTTSGVSTDTAVVHVTAMASDIMGFVGTYRVKVAFVQPDQGKNKLYYIDFSETPPVVHAIADTGDARNPFISPDGGRVAYSSVGLGFSGPSNMTLRVLDAQSKAAPTRAPSQPAYLPKWWVDPNGSDTNIIFTDGASPNDQPHWYLEKTWRQAVTGLSFTGAPTLVWSTGSYNAGLSSDGRFLMTGYPRCRVVDLQIGDTNITYFTTPYNGRTDNPQVCNVSASPSRAEPGEAVLLDFGYTGVSTLVGSPYGFHAVMFRCNMQMLTQGGVSGWWMVPPPYTQWDHLAYSNHPSFVTAVVHSGISTSGDAIYMVNLADSSFLRIATGANLLDPQAWIDPVDVAEIPDPYRYFGRYDLPIQEEGQIILNEKLRLFWKNHGPIDCAVLGSSPAYYGIDPHYLPHFTAVNCGAWASDMMTSTVMGIDYALTQSPRLKALIVSLDPGSLSNNFFTERGRLDGLYDSKGFELDTQNGFWRAGLPAGVLDKISAYGPGDWPDVDSSGFGFRTDTPGWGPALIDKGDYNIADTAVQFNLARITLLADSAANHGVHVLMISFPESPGYDTTVNIGRLGPSRTTYAQLVVYLRNLESQNSYFHFYDANNYGNHDYTNADALDCNHLSYLGARKLSIRADSILAQYVH